MPPGAPARAIAVVSWCWSRIGEEEPFAALRFRWVVVGFVLTVALDENESLQMPAPVASARRAWGNSIDEHHGIDSDTAWVETERWPANAAMERPKWKRSERDHSG